MSSLRRGALGLAIPPLLFLASAAHATVNHGNFVGSDVDFLDVSETTLSPGDAEPLWDAPMLAGAGNQLIFFPTNFTSSCGGFGSDTTASEFTTTIVAKGGTHIDQIAFVEYGDASLSAFPPPGSPATNATAAIAGTLTVTETTGGPIAPVVIPFAATIVPDPVFELPADAGTHTWSTGSVSIDVSAVVPDATRVELSLENTLESSCAPTSAVKIQKKVVTGPIVTLGTESCP